jgi:hypothetical protein
MARHKLPIRALVENDHRTHADGRIGEKVDRGLGIAIALRRSALNVYCLRTRKRHAAKGGDNSALEIRHVVQQRGRGEERIVELGQTLRKLGPMCVRASLACRRQ